MTLVDVVEEVKAELTRARGSFPAFSSYDEGISVLVEEIEELRQAVHVFRFSKAEAEDGHPRGKEIGKRIAIQLKQLEKELVQVAAMAARFAVDLCPASDDLHRDITGWVFQRVLTIVSDYGPLGHVTRTFHEGAGSIRRHQHDLERYVFEGRLPVQAHIAAEKCVALAAAAVQTLVDLF